MPAVGPSVSPFSSTTPTGATVHIVDRVGHRVHPAIGSNAFSLCAMLQGPLELPESLRTIGSEAFKSDANLTGVLVIPDGVESVGQDAFHGTAAKTNGSTTYNGKLEDSNPYKFFEHYRGDSADD